MPLTVKALVEPQEPTKPAEQKPATIGGQNYKIKVKVPATVVGGAGAPVRMILAKKGKKK